MSLCLVLFTLLLSTEASAQEVTTAPVAYETSEVSTSSFDIVASVAEGPSLTAAEAVRLAMESSPTLSRARALTRAADASVERVRVNMWPRFELSAGYQHVDGFEDGTIPLQADPAAIEAQRQLAAMVSDPAAQALWTNSINATEAANGVTIPVPRDRINFGARLSWPVSDFFFAILPSVDAAEAGARVREHEQAATEAGVRRSTHEAYLTLVRARGTHAVAIEAERQADARRAEIEAGVRAGFLTPADGLAAESRVAEAAQLTAQTLATVEITDAALRTLIGADDGDVYGVVLDSDPPEAVDYETAIDNRAELRALRAALDAQRASARSIDAGGYPHLAVFAGADYGNPNRYQVPPNQVFMPSWEVGASLRWSPNDTVGAVRHGDQISAEQLATEAQIEGMKRMIRLELRQAEAQLRAARRGIEAATASVTAARAAYESRQAQLRAGGATTADVYDTERQLNRARLALLDAHVQLQLAAVHLAYAGGLL